MRETRRRRGLLLGVRFAAVALALLFVYLPRIRMELFSDDIVIANYLRGLGPPARPFRGALDLFRTADSVDQSLSLADGSVPWWFDPDQRAVFFRPLASGIMALEHKLFALDPTILHLHSLLWFFAFLLATELLLARLGVASRVTRALVFIVVAFSPLAASPIGWWSARNALVYATFANLALSAHLAWREKRWSYGPWPSVAAFALALLGGEGGVQLMAFVVPHALFTETRWRERLRAVLPGTVTLVLYAFLRRSQGAGVLHSPQYIDPLGDPAAFARNVVELFPKMIASLFASPATLLGLSDRQGLFAGLGVLVVSAALVVPALARDATLRRRIGWLLVGAVLATLPAFGLKGALHDYVLLFPFTAVASAVGLAVESSPKRSPPARLATLAGVALAVIFLAGVPLVRMHRQSEQVFARVTSRHRSFDPLLNVSADRFVMLGGQSTTMTWLRYLRPNTNVQGAYVICTPGGKYTLTRESERSMIVTALESTLIPNLEVWRLEGLPYREKTVRTGPMTITLVEAKGSLPTKIRIDLDEAPDDRTALVVRRGPAAFDRRAWPAVGETVTFDPRGGRESR